MTTPLGLESDIKNPIEHASIGKQFLQEHEDNIIFGALAKPLNDLLVEANAPKNINFLSLDVEGAEIEVLKGINHDEFRFEYICIECRDEQKIILYLKHIGYEFVEKLSIHDYLFKDSRNN